MVYPPRAIVLCLVLVSATLSALATNTAGESGAAPPAQVLPVRQLEPWGHLGGEVRALVAAGDRIYVGAGPRVVVLDATGVGDPRELAASPVLDGDVFAVDESGGLVFAGYGIADEGDPNGMAIVDGRASGLAPVISQLPLLGRPVAVWAEGDSVTVATRLQVRDSRPYPTATVMPFPTSTALAPAAGGEASLESATYHGGEILRVDVSDATAPRIVGRLALPEVPVDMEVVGDQLYVLTSQVPGDFQSPASIVRVSLSDVTRPERLGTFPLGDVDADGFDVEGGYAYVVAGFVGLMVLDLADPNRPRQVATLELFSGSDVLAVDDRAYVTDVSATMIIDISDPIHPAYVGEFNGPVGSLAVASQQLLGALSYFGSDAPFVGNRNAVGVFDLPPDGAPPLPVGRWMTPTDMTSAVVSGSRLYLDFGGAQLIEVEAEPDAAPRIVAATRWQGSGWSLSCNAMALLPGYLALTNPCGSPSGLSIARLGPSGAPEPLAGLSLEAMASHIAADGELVGVTVQTAFGLRGPPPVPVEPALRVYDLSDPAMPQVVSEVVHRGASVGVAMGDGLAYLATTRDLMVIDLSRPEAPVELARLSDLDGKADMWSGNGAALAGDRLAVRTGAGVRLFDVSDPRMPVDAGTIQAAGIKQIALSDGLLVVATEDDSQRIFVNAYELEGTLASPIARRQLPSSVIDLLFQEERLVVVTGDSGVFWLASTESIGAVEQRHRVWLPLLDGKGLR